MKEYRCPKCKKLLFMAEGFVPALIPQMDCGKVDYTEDENGGQTFRGFELKCHNCKKIVSLKF